MLTYCSEIWSPHYVKDVLLIESVQRTFTKRIPGYASLSYADRLKLLKIPTLERRRLENDLKMCYKILHGLVAGSPENYGLELSNRQSRGHSLKLKIEQPGVDVRKFYFANRVANPWNSLSESTVTCNNLRSFKRLVRRAKLDEFLYIKV